MKRFLATILMMTMMAVIVPFAATTANAQTTRPNFYKRHRNIINVALGTGGGALLGGIIGGKKGALLGTAIGAGSSALYTYKLNPKTRRYYRVRRY